MMLGDSLGNLCLSECLYYVVSTFVLLLLRGLVSSVLYYTYMYFSWCIINWYKPCVVCVYFYVCMNFRHQIITWIHSKLKALTYLSVTILLMDFNKKKKNRKKLYRHSENTSNKQNKHKKSHNLYLNLWRCVLHFYEYHFISSQYDSKPLTQKRL